MSNAPSVIAPDSRFLRRRATIIKSAAHVFGRKGFHAATLEEIAAELKVTKASLYYYFSTKEELLYEVHLLSMTDVLARLESVRAAYTSPVEQLQEAITQHLRVLAGDYEGAFLLQQEYELPDPYREEIVRLRDRYEQGLLEIVHAGVRSRVFRVKDARVAVRMMLGGVNWFVRWYRAGGRLTVDEIADAYIDFIFYGLLAPAAITAGPESPAGPPTKLRRPGTLPRQSRKSRGKSGAPTPS